MWESRSSLIGRNESSMLFPRKIVCGCMFLCRNSGAIANLFEHCKCPRVQCFHSLGGEFADGRESSAPTIKAHLYRVVAADNFIMVLMAFTSRAFPPRELAI